MINLTSITWLIIKAIYKKLQFSPGWKMTQQTHQNLTRLQDFLQNQIN